MGLVDKSNWFTGSWSREPDVAQWQDVSTKLSCLIIRNYIGGLCGYVGVETDHHLWGRDFTYVNTKTKTIRAIEV